MKHELPQKFIERMEKQLGDEFAVFLAQYDKEPVRGLRVNTLKLSTESFLELSGYELVPTDILTEGFCLKGELKVKNDPYHFAGLYYMQEPSAMSAVAAARIKKGMNVLDLCAAPGGKSSSAAAHM
ncbi:MAG: rRNA cytosine-C5-methyltransferase, partial [Clostridia bacterium]|nr:rRNA cytosine-C5-methyltransferase [Clostridia bacterium]